MRVRAVATAACTLTAVACGAAGGRCGCMRARRTGRAIAGRQRSYRAACASDAAQGGERAACWGLPQAARGDAREGGRGAGGVRPATDPEEWHIGTFALPSMALRDGALQITGACVYSIVMAIGRRASRAGAGVAFARAVRAGASSDARQRGRWPHGRGQHLAVGVGGK